MCPPGVELERRPGVKWRYWINQEWESGTGAIRSESAPLDLLGLELKRRSQSKVAALKLPGVTERYWSSRECGSGTGVYGSGRTVLELLGVEMWH